MSEKNDKNRVGKVGKNIFFIDIFECHKCGATIYKTAYKDEKGYICQKCAWEPYLEEINDSQ